MSADPDPPVRLPGFSRVRWHDPNRGSPLGDRASPLGMGDQQCPRFPPKPRPKIDDQRQAITIDRPHLCSSVP